MNKILILLTLIFTTSAFGWGDMGHSSIGYIAEKNLTPNGKKFIYSILGPEPMGISALFPDQVRADSRYVPFAPYHFLEIPPGTTFKDIPADRFVARSANTIIEEAPNLIFRSHKRHGLMWQQKQILMRYLIHVVGDVHQPLHVGNGLDRGGNYCDIKMADGTKKNLHSFWDTTIIDSMNTEVLAATKESFLTFQVFGDWLVAEAEKSGLMTEVKEQVSKTSKDDWYAESQALHAEVYPDASPTAPQDREYCKIIDPQTGAVVRPSNHEKIPVITDEYMAKAKVIIKKRILLAGLRLADVINKLAVKRGDQPMSAEEEAKLFQKMMPESKAPRGPSSKSKLKIPVH